MRAMRSWVTVCVGILAAFGSVDADEIGWHASGKGEVKVLCGLGGAPQDPDSIDWFYRNPIPADGSLKPVKLSGQNHNVLRGTVEKSVRASFLTFDLFKSTILLSRRVG